MLTTWGLQDSQQKDIKENEEKWKEEELNQGEKNYKIKYILAKTVFYIQMHSLLKGKFITDNFDNCTVKEKIIKTSISLLTSPLSYKLKPGGLSIAYLHH